MGEEKSILQLGGIGGLLGGAFVVVGLVILIALAPPLPWSAEDFLVNAADFRTPFLVGFNLFLFSGLGFAVLYLALYRSLRKTSPASALFGVFSGAISIALFAVLFGGVLTSGVVLSDLYAAATPGDRAMLLAATEATNSLVTGINAVAALWTGIAISALGVAMLGSPEFHKGFGWVSIVLGIIALISFLSPSLLLLTAIPVTIFALLLGWKVYSLSRAA